MAARLVADTMALLEHLGHTYYAGAPIPPAFSNCIGQNRGHQDQCNHKPARVLSTVGLIHLNKFIWHHKIRLQSALIIPGQTISSHDSFRLASNISPFLITSTLQYLLCTHLNNMT
ncbi:hypothetical protein KIL84_003560 [Mauremys mutica]|uniref:Uncharacterized protein n=1 Tax=Mauremys mutica TaxID=74926 RepID=A0A9D3WVZ0_9SAUR|nr:hypothetical protein KIL84_003560 [Mauremys mutica]